MSTRFRTSALAMVAVAGFALLGTPREAHAILAIAFQVQQGVTTVQAYAVDNNVVPPGYTPAAGYVQVFDTDPTVGTLSLATFTPIVGYTVAGSVQTQAIGTTPGTFNSLNSSALTVTNNTGGTVTATVAISGTDYTPPVFVANASGSITWQDAIGSTISGTWWDDPANGQGAESATDLPGNLIHSWIDTAVELADGGSTASGPVPVVDLVPFSMSLGFVLTTIDPDSIVNGGRSAVVVNRGQTELKQVSAVPEPATMAMVAAGLPLLGLGYLRRRNATKA